MAGVAKLMIEKGYEVSGSDKDFYPPMSEYLETLKIDLIKGYDSQNLPEADLYVIGNVISRGNESFEKILSNKLPYTSGPKIIADLTKEENLIAVTGTHGKTTTSYMLCHIFIENGIDIGYLVGGISPHFQDSAKLGTANIFIIEGDEYDSALFDKRSKFINYNPHSIIINNIEFDHADIFEDIEAIIKNFHHLVRIIPKSGKIIYNEDDKNIKKLIKKGVWSKLISLTTNKNIKSDWLLSEKNESFFLSDRKKTKLIESNLIGLHNYKNISLAILVALQIKVPLSKCIKAIKAFKGVKRRMEFMGTKDHIMIFDDFAHHPTEIQSSIQSLKRKYKNKNILSICEIKSNSMISGAHKTNLPKALKLSNKSIIIKSPLSKWSISDNDIKLFNDYKKVIDYINKNKSLIDIILIMSNKSTTVLRNEIEK